MSGLYFSVGADFQKLQQLKKDLDDLKSKLKGMDSAADKKAFEALNRQLQQAQREYDTLAGKLSRYVAEQNRASQATSSSANEMLSLFAKIGGTTALIGLGKQVMDVRNEFQQLEIAFGTMLKSTDKAASLMKDLTKFAAETPFGLQSAASGAKQLLAYGSTADTVIKELTMLGDVAAGTGQQIGDLVYLYGTLRTQGRAYLMDIRQFAGRGIPIYDELAKVLNTSKDKVNDFVSAGKVGFKEVEQAFKNMTSQGGLYGGLMEEQSKSIGGRMEALKDNIDSIFNTIGKDSEGVIYKSIDGVNALVENYDKVGKILVGLIATYGTYRTALIVNAVATQSLATTQFQLGIILARTQKLWQALMASMSINPYVLAATVMVGLVTTMWALRDATSSEEKAIKRLNDEMDRYNEKVETRKSKADSLIRLIKDETETEQAKIRALKELQTLYPSIFNNMDVESVKLANEVELKKKRNKEEEIYTKEKYQQLILEAKQRISANKQGGNAGMYSNGYDILVKKSIADDETLIKEYEKVISDLDKQDQKAAEKIPKAIAEQAEDARKKVSDLKKELKDLRSGKTSSDDYSKAIEDKVKELKEAEDKLSFIIYGKSSSGYDKDSKSGESAAEKARKLAQEKIEAEQWLLNKQKELGNEQIRFELESEEKRLKNQQENIGKQQKLNEINYKKALLDAKDFEAQKEKEQQEAAEKIYIKKNGSNKGFDFSKFDKKSLPPQLQPEFIREQTQKMTAIAQEEWESVDFNTFNEEQQTWNEFYKLYGNYQEKKLAITKEYAAKIAKASNDAERAALKKEQESALARLFTEGEEYQRFFTSIYSLTKKEAINIGNLIKDNLYEQMKKGVISAQEYFDAVQQIREELKKSSEGVNYLGNYQKGGIDGLFGSMKSKAESDRNNALIDLKKYTDEYNKFLEMGDEKSASIAKNNIIMSDGAAQGAEGMMNFASAAQGAVMMVDQIVTAIDQSVRATQRIVDVFADLAEQRGIDTTKGTWAEVRETMSVMSKVNEKAKESWDSLKNGDAAGALASTVEMISIFFKSANGEHKKALELLKRQEDQVKHLYEIEKARKELQESGKAILGTDEWGKANKAVSTYNNSVKDLDKSLEKMNETWLITGSKKSGWGPFKKRKDVWSPILDAYPDLIKANGEFDKELAKVILSTRTLTDEGKEYLQMAIDNAELVEEAYASMKDYLSGIFDSLGNTIMSTFVDAFKGAKDAIIDFKESASDMLGSLTEDFIYSMRLAPIIESASKQVEDIMLNGSISDEEKNKRMLDIIGNTIDSTFKQQEAVNKDLEYWGEYIRNLTGANPFTEKQTQSSSYGTSTAMDQETGGVIAGRLTGIMETNLRSEGYLKSISEWNKPIDEKLSLDAIVAPIASLNESSLRVEQILQENRSVTINSYYELRGINKNTSVLPEMNDRLGNIEKNTKGLVSK